MIDLYLISQLINFYIYNLEFVYMGLVTKELNLKQLRIYILLHYIIVTWLYKFSNKVWLAIIPCKMLDKRELKRVLSNWKIIRENNW